MKILYGNFMLSGRTGTEIVTLETTDALKKRGHDVCVYSANIGESAHALRAKGIPVISHLADTPWQPDIAHCNQWPLSINIAAHFPLVPQVYVCHDYEHWLNTAIDLSVVRTWASVSELLAQRICRDLGKEVAVVRLLNAVDLDVFRPRQPLPEKPRRALLDAKQEWVIAQVQKACDKAGLPLDVVGPAVNRTIDDFAAHLHGYDLVFGSGRIPTEALAIGCAVIVMDGRGYAGLVTSTNVADWWRRNFGLQILTGALDPDMIAQDIAHYDAADSAKAAQYIRAHASLDDYMTQLEGVYQRTVDEFAANPVPIETTLKEVVPALLKPVAQQARMLGRSAATQHRLAQEISPIDEHSLIEIIDRIHQTNTSRADAVSKVVSKAAKLKDSIARRLRRR